MHYKKRIISKGAYTNILLNIKNTKNYETCMVIPFKVFSLINFCWTLNLEFFLGSRLVAIHIFKTHYCRHVLYTNEPLNVK